MDRMLNLCVFLRVRAYVWDRERMCWALLAADLEDFASLEGIDAVWFFCQVCVWSYTPHVYIQEIKNDYSGGDAWAGFS